METRRPRIDVAQQNERKKEKDLHLLHDLDNVLVLQHVLLADALGPMLGTRAPHQRILELLDHGLVELVAEVLDRAPVARHDHGILPVRQPPLWLCIHLASD